MKQFSGKYQAIGYNSKTDRAFYGDLELKQEGSKLHGSYKFSMSWKDASPVSFSLPEYDCAVEGYILDDNSKLTIPDDSAFLTLKYESPQQVKPHAVLKLGDKEFFILQLGNGALITASEPTMTLTSEIFNRMDNA